MTAPVRPPSPEDFARAFEGLVDVAVVADPDGRILAANEAAAAFWGYRRDELGGRRMDDLISADGAAQREFLLEKVRSEEGVKEVCLICRTRDDRRVPMFFSVSALKDGRRLSALVYIGREMAETRSLLEQTAGAAVSSRKKVEELQLETCGFGRAGASDRRRWCTSAPPCSRSWTRSPRSRGSMCRS